jgi:hypothetical protein
VSVLVGTRAIGDNQGVSLQDPFKLPPEQLAGDDGYGDFCHAAILRPVHATSIARTALAT